MLRAGSADTRIVRVSVPHARPRPRALGALAAAATAACLAAAPAGGVAAAPAAGTVLVRMDPGAGAAERAGIARALGATSSRPLMAGWRAYELPARVSLAAARRELTGAGAAEAVQLDARVYPLGDPDDTHFALQWPLARIAATQAWSAHPGGAPVVVAVVDTGVDTGHPDLQGALWTNPGEIPGNGVDDDGNGLVDDTAGWDFAGDDRTVYDDPDEDLHGTHVAGTIAAVRDNARGVAGVAANARVMPVKFLRGEAGGTVSDGIAAIRYAIDNGARVINASWGTSSPSPALCDAVAEAVAAGAVVVAAAGNSGTDNDAAPRWPASCPSSGVVSVAATTSADELAAFSNRGATSVDLGAPGQSVLSTVPQDGYAYLSGTSMAAPHVAGAAAAVLGLDPGLAPWQVRAAITGGGDPLPALAGATSSGRRLNLAGALAAATAGVGPDATPPDPFGVGAPADGTVTAAARPTFSWSPASDAQSGVVGYRLVVGGATAATALAGTTSATPAAALPEGQLSWHVVATDAGGNARAGASRTLVVDRTPPQAPPPLAPAAGARVRGGSLDLSWGAAADAVSGVAAYRIIVDGAPVAELGPDARAARVALDAGDHAWEVRAVDRAGNEGPGIARSATILPPRAAVRQITLRAAAGRAGRRPVLRVRLAVAGRATVIVTRGGRGIGRFALRLRPGRPAAVAVPRRVARRMARPGRYVVTVRAPGHRPARARLVVRSRARR